ncbi:hypothetical protein EJB05_22538 [Eragrostis curvula]|uniref:Fatty acyl-CoA reductase n=1 Tax=Eragrostis curvula TaxID=38414 RepID=A0A5J9V5V0_9POAL|nr:hypothetical protein EJB05_22538 [Eragrostis curvula]
MDNPSLNLLCAIRKPSSIVGMGQCAQGRGVLLHSTSYMRQRNVSAASSNSLSVSGDSRASTMAPISDLPSTGIGIKEFLKGKNFLITGGTGFLAKVLIEKILRMNPAIGKIYVMIKAKDIKTASRRMQNEVFDTELFKCLREINGNDYHSIVETKLVPVIGDVREAGIGISIELADKIAQEVDIIVNSAGNTTFDESCSKCFNSSQELMTNRYDTAMDINTLGPLRVLSFAHRFQRLKLFMHVSTAYVNGQRQGVVLEKPFRLGDTIAGELGSSEQKNVVLDIETEIKTAFNYKIHSNSSTTFVKEMKDLGLRRAKLYGWQDTYVFTKAMGEMGINCMRGEIPVVTIRPSIIESTLTEPFPGWIEGSRMIDPVILYYGKGHISGFAADPDGVLDVVPADMVVNAMLASMAKHGQAEASAAGMHVYHVTSSTVNPLVLGDLAKLLFQYFKRSPFIDAARKPIPVSPVRLFDSTAQFASNMESNTPLLNSRARASSSNGKKLSKRAIDLRARLIQQITHLGSIYEPYTFYDGRFDSTNTEALLAEMSLEERAQFNFDVRSIEWKDYITNVHIPGLMKHVMKGRGSDVSSGL